MKEIILHNGMKAKVDDSDYDSLNQFNWTAHYHIKGKVWYAERNTGKIILMHRMIMGNPDGFLVDHADRNGLNNQRNNLRKATRSQNNANRKSWSTKKCTSKYLGVAFEKDRQKWTARIRKDTRGYRLGSFSTEYEAAIAYNTAAIKFHGEFANLNRI